MKRRRFLFIAALALLTAGLSHRPAIADSCDECRAYCDQIPQETQECLQENCSECAGSSLTVG